MNSRKTGKNGCPNSPRMVEFIAHRGASRDAPENTVAAVKLAWFQNADAVEVDVQLTQDGKLLVFHDANTKRIAGTNKRIDHHTLAELQLLDAGKWKGKHW